MKSTGLFAGFVRCGAMGVIGAVSLAGCSTMKDLSPFGSNVPYSQDVQPTTPRPANSEIPAFTPAPPKPAAPAATPAAPASNAPPAPTSPAAQSSLSAQPDEKLAAAAPVAAAPIPRGRPGHPVTRPADVPAAIPDEDREFKDDGTYRNLAQVPARPVNLPTFLEASTEEKVLIADRENAKDKRPDSPEVPSPDTSPATASTRPAAAAAPAPAAAVAERAEDRSPCLSPRPVDGEPAAVLHFEPGSSALNSDDLIILAEAIPNVRGGKGAIRVFGHGDTDAPMSEMARFDLATARAGAVAQALAGYGIPAPRIAVGVACADASVAGASVQLYAES